MLEEVGLAAAGARAALGWGVKGVGLVGGLGGLLEERGQKTLRDRREKL